MLGWTHWQHCQAPPAAGTALLPKYLLRSSSSQFLKKILFLKFLAFGPHLEDAQSFIHSWPWAQGSLVADSGDRNGVWGPNPGWSYTRQVSLLCLPTARLASGNHTPFLALSDTAGLRQQQGRDCERRPHRPRSAQFLFPVRSFVGVGCVRAFLLHPREVPAHVSLGRRLGTVCAGL